ncbi:integration host factor subunit alpha [Persephonella hydrogeniphila]|uniref:Integration host factor subunit alpha n=1 Tax=Persephonella hydrogeniphila TaxID=198703 RepID=A0A285NHT5_9AQUI|nr:HU family DNA-binding protein [Persephonella hydrogeniphila]SNZ08473.1 integration host factor subunit alpha [Persephonella hydrogeniphila]
MTKADIVNWIAQNKDIKASKRDISKVVNRIFEIIAEELIDGEDNHKIQISGFGTFIVKKRAPKIGRNPKTREEKLIPERFGISFKVGKKLHRKLNGE